MEGTAGPPFCGGIAIEMLPPGLKWAQLIAGSLYLLGGPGAGRCRQCERGEQRASGAGRLMHTHWITKPPSFYSSCRRHQLRHTPAHMDRLRSRVCVAAGGDSQDTGFRLYSLTAPRTPAASS